MVAAIPTSPRHVYRQGVDSADKVLADGRVNAPVAFKPTHPRKDLGGNDHMEMRLAPLAPAGMTTMKLALVLDRERDGSERLSQALLNLIGDLSQVTPSPCRQKP